MKRLLICVLPTKCPTANRPCIGIPGVEPNCLVCITLRRVMVVNTIADHPTACVRRRIPGTETDRRVEILKGTTVVLAEQSCPPARRKSASQARGQSDDLLRIG